ncbi:MAG: hypothetical protein IKL52_07580 [Candidatus Gastranaerophilales bacterium]|nr:hypothetical protein [Candidatus Gastranaerophilales bacterium]
MIQPLKLNSNINFKSNGQLSAANAAVVDKRQEAQAQPQQEKKSIVDTYLSAKKTVTGFFKGVNNVLGVSTGAAQGVVEGAVAAGVVGIIGKNIKNGEGKILETSVGILKDAWSAIKVVPKTIKNIWLNSPKDNLAKLFKETIPNAVKKIGPGLKKHKASAIIAAGVGVAVFAMRTVQGKVSANIKNANLEHATNQGHV